jgi:D-sedoheptulose 7-phosphate isomerase
MNQNYIEKYYLKFQSLLFLQKDIIKKILTTAIAIKKISRGNKVIIFGNGGSSAIASHFTVDLIKNTKINCLNFSDAALITCFSNDYGYENWIAKALDVYAKKGDLVILISSSGVSKNILKAASASRKKGTELITLTGFKKSNKLSKLGKVNFWVNSKNYNHIENIHQLYLLSVCDMIAGKKF